MRLLVFSLLAIFAFENGFGQQAPNPAKSSAVLDPVFNQGYDHRERPVPRQGGPTNVTVDTYLRRVVPIDDGFLVTLTFRQKWNDPRLSFAGDTTSFINLPPRANADRRIWVPDTFFQNADDVKLYSDPTPNELIRVYSNGDVLWSQRLSMKLPCSEVEEKSLAKQCNLDFASYGYTSDDINYVWKNDTPVQLKDGLAKSIPFFELQKVATSSCMSKTSTGAYSCLRAELNFKKTTPSKLSAKLYVIPLLLVIVSWVPFIINTHELVVRALFGLTCLSTLILHWSIVGAELPKFGSATSSDVWFTRCLGFIAATFIQLIFFAWIVRGTASHKERKLAKLRFTREKEIVEEEVVLVRKEPIYKEDPSVGVGFMVDMISLAIFVLAFFVFLLHFFTKY